MPTHAKQRKWSDKFIPAQIQYFIDKGFKRKDIKIADYKSDCEEATDLFVKDKRIALRIRKSSYQCYSDEFTVHYRLPTGHVSEFTKIVRGWGDYMLYGFAVDDKKYDEIEPIHLLDLNVFRKLYKIRDNGKPKGREQPLNDGTGKFVIYQLKDFPGIIVG